MKVDHSHIRLLLGLALLCIALFVVNISLGSVSIPLRDVIHAVLGWDVTKDSWETIILNYRLPKAITAVLVGSGLSISGLLMQTLFRNPLAGPFVLGISSGASLGVALLLMGFSLFGSGILILEFGQWSLPIAASIGSFVVLLSVILAANRLRNTMSILIVGLMFGSFTAAIISILAYFSEAREIQQYTFWNFGSLGNLSWNELGAFSFIYAIGFIGLFFVIKPLNSLLLGEHYAKSMGINIKKSRMLILLITSIFTGVITAFAGPIAFIGLAAPHIARIWFATSNHKILIPSTALIGAMVMLICDGVAQLPTSEFTLPINAITSLFGAPIVIWLLIRKKKIVV